MVASRSVSVVMVACALVGVAYGVGAAARSESAAGENARTFTSVDHGRQLWFENTYSNDRFFSFLASHPDPARRLRVAFDAVVATPRANRFDTWGTLNDPDCTASTDPSSPQDVCPDASATGVIGIRKVNNPSGTSRYGLTCAFCHAGFDPIDPPADSNNPTWANIHPTIGNGYLKAGAILGANLAATDTRRLMLQGWTQGTFDSTFLFTDHIMNPEAITPIWELQHKPAFDVGLVDSEVRSGRGGEDDLGLDALVVRKYLSLGVCHNECVVSALTAGQPISIDACRVSCADLPSEADVDDVTTFLESIDAPQYRGPRNGAKYAAGRNVFATQCSSCHDASGKTNRLLSNDEVNALAADAANAPNSCRALTTNWDAGKLWDEFSSTVHKTRAAAGAKGYRTAPLAGIWATAPFLHNESVGAPAAPTASTDTRALAFEQALLELLSSSRPPIIKRTAVALGPFPAGTPLTSIFSRDPATGTLLCSDTIENRGHYYGSTLSAADKAALIEFLKFQ